MAVSERPTIDSTGDEPPLGPSESRPEVGGNEARLYDLERKAIGRDGWTLTIFGFSALALVASVLAVIISVQAGSDAKRQARSAAAAAVAASTPKVAPAAAAAVAPKITLAEFNVAATVTEVAAGAHDVVITNSGSVAHELLVFKSDLSAAQFPVDAAGNIVEDGPGITILSDGPNLDPGTSQDRTITLTEPGKYLYLCNLAGHFKKGMFVQVTVR